MNILKSLFISVLPFAGLAIVIYAGYQLSSNGLLVNWTGAFLAGFGIVLFFSLVFFVE